MTWLERGLARDQRWSDDQIVEWTADEEHDRSHADRRIVDVFDALDDPDSSETPRDVFAEWASSLDRSEFVESDESAPIDLSEVDAAAPLPGLLGDDDPMATLAVGPTSFSDDTVATDDITALTHDDDHDDVDHDDDHDDDHDETLTNDLDDDGQPLVVDAAPSDNPLTAQPVESVDQTDEPIAQSDPFDDVVESAVADAFEPDTAPAIDDVLESNDDIVPFDDPGGEA